MKNHFFTKPNCFQHLQHLLPFSSKVFNRTSFLFFLFGLFFQSLTAQNRHNLKFEHFGLEEGLSQVTARCLLEDQDGFIWVGTQDGLNRFDGYSFKVFRNDLLQNGSLSSSFIQCMMMGRNGSLLIGTNDGLNIYDPKSETFQVIRGQAGNSTHLSSNVITALLEDSKGRVWIGTKTGLNILNRDKGMFAPVQVSDLANSIRDMCISSLLEDDVGNIWVGTKNGLYFLEKETNTVSSFFNDPADNASLSSNEITEIFQDANGQMWIGTKNGLNRFATHGGSNRFVHNSHVTGSISDDYIHKIFQDSDNHLWVTTANGGINLFNHSTETFQSYQHDPEDPSSLGNNSVMDMIEDRNGNFWIGVSNRGLNFHDPRTQRFQHIKYQPNKKLSLIDNAVRSILKTKNGKLWVGSFTGLSVMDLEKNNTLYYQHDPNNPYSLSANYVLSLVEDHQGTIFTGTAKGLHIFHPEENRFSEFQINHKKPFANSAIGPMMVDAENNLWLFADSRGLYKMNDKGRELTHYPLSNTGEYSSINAIFQDSKRRVWIGTGSGLVLHQREGEQLQFFKHVPSDEATISNNIITCITEDTNGRIWVGTIAGLNLYDEKQGAFKSYRVSDGLSNEYIYGALVDDNGEIWISTNKGINRFNPETETFTVYDKADGLQSNEFNGRAYFKDENGLLYFGGVNGLSIFHPDSIQESTNTPNVVLTNFLLFNKPVRVSDSSALHQSLDLIEEITLDHTEDMFAFEFSALNYAQAEKNQFAYRLDPFNSDWIYTNAKDRKAVYTRVPPGTYTFQVKASNDDGYWTPEAKEITVKILPAWWQTWWAKMLYAVISMFAIGLIIRFQWRRAELKNKLRLEQQEAEQLKALDKLKTQFFSNITHEFRTPLTLILGPAEQVLKQAKLDESFTRGQVELIRRNSQKLLKLINQLLDLSKIEGNSMRLELYQGDLREFIKDIVENFQSAAQQKHIQLNLHSMLSIRDYQFDRDKLEKIMYNLLSNAMKFTPERGAINVAISTAGTFEKNIAITVQDTGIGIPSDKLQHVFDRFFQVEESNTRTYEGTGIGLALTKELVELQGGTIEVQSELGKGSQFYVELPLKEAIIHEQKESVNAADYPLPETITLDTLIDTEEVVDNESDKPIILIIEDNNDLRSFIQSILLPDFQIITAKDGAEGIESALKHIPDLIVSDVMMPLKDGFEVTKALKKNPLSSHIPIILLTAKSALQSRVSGLKEGADAYLTKPFSVEELLLVVSGQIETRKLLQEKFSHCEESKNTETTYNEVDQELIDKLHDFIESELSNEELTVEDLVKKAEMSHSQLYRKIKALTNMSIAGFIRSYRLSRAMEFLKEGTHNVTQVADKTGFSDRRYFHKAFTSKFNHSPSQVPKREKLF